MLAGLTSVSLASMAACRDMRSVAGACCGTCSEQEPGGALQVSLMQQLPAFEMLFAGGRWPKLGGDASSAAEAALWKRDRAAANMAFCISTWQLSSAPQDLLVWSRETVELGTGIRN